MKTQCHFETKMIATLDSRYQSLQRTLKQHQMQQIKIKKLKTSYHLNEGEAYTGLLKELKNNGIRVTHWQLLPEKHIIEFAAESTFESLYNLLNAITGKYALVLHHFLIQPSHHPGLLTLIMRWVIL